MFDTDEHPRPQTTMQSLAKLPPVFKKDGTVTAGNASGICDGAAANVVASEDALWKHDLKPLARIAGYGVTACEPSIMGIGPVAASKLALERAGLKMSDMDLIEVNEAFAPVVLAWAKETGADLAKTNVNGGAIAIGHPLGASGARLMTTLVNTLQHSGKRYGLQTMCEAGGMANATIIERLG